MPSSPSGFRVESRELDDCFVVDCHGRLTGENAPLLRDEVRALIPRHKSILIDLQDVPMLDSSGLGAIAGLYVSARTRGISLALANANPQIRNLFRVTNLVELFDVVGRHGRL
jgi:anti-sigma B factor antagonist